MAAIRKMSSYIGRFAPSPTGPLHAGSLVAALASWLDAKAHQGQWLVRIEDVDAPRCVAGMDRVILGQLQQFGLLPDAPPAYQSQRTDLYQQALEQLTGHGLAYPCHCSRKTIEAALMALGKPRARHGELAYPGTCRHGAPQPEDKNRKTNPAWRLRTDLGWSNRPISLVDIAYIAPFIVAKEKFKTVDWIDRRLGPQSQQVEKTVGDFPLKRPDGCFTYQLAVVVDDAAQGITHVVRGADLADNTARQILLQRALGLPTPAYLHTPLVLGANGEKLSKQNGAQALDTANPLAVMSALNAAALVLGLPGLDPVLHSGDLPGELSGDHAQGDALAVWVNAWRQLYLDS